MYNGAPIGDHQPNMSRLTIKEASNILKANTTSATKDDNRMSNGRTYNAQDKHITQRDPTTNTYDIQPY